MALVHELPTAVLVTEFANVDLLTHVFEGGVSTSIITGGTVLVTEFSGPPGRDGRDGVDGRDGRDGVDGKDGQPGRDAVDGAPGRDGRDGRDGKDGAAAPSRPVPTLVQKTALQNDGDLVLPKKPTVGNMLVLVTAGWNTSLKSYAPPGFVAVGSYINGFDNSCICWIKAVTADDTPVYSLSAPDNQLSALYEFSGFRGVLPLFGGAMDALFTGSNYSFYMTPAPFPSVRLGIFEQDIGGSWTIDPATGLTVDLYASLAPSEYHSGVAFHLDDSFQGPISGAVSGSWKYPVMGVFAVFG